MVSRRNFCKTLKRSQSQFDVTGLYLGSGSVLQHWHEPGKAGFCIYGCYVPELTNTSLNVHVC
jgi:hypothetical protein